LIDGFAGRGSVEFISEFAHELPARVFLTLMGWPLQDAPMFTEATDTTLHGVLGGTEEEGLAAREAAAGRMMNYFAAVVAAKRDGSADQDDVTVSKA
jgi:cytochrome P450